MIRYALQCEHDHGFEAWFGTSADYDEQAAKGLVECPVCGSHAVRKQIMAPAVAGVRKAAPEPDLARMQTMMMQAAREARDIHEGRSEKREIYGEATPAEVKKLRDDGVPCARLPPAPPDPSRLN